MGIPHRDSAARARAAALERRVLTALEAIGCLWAREIPGPAGRTSDFLVRRGDTRLAIHVKDLALDPARAVRMPGWLASMATLRRRILVGIEDVGVARRGRPPAEQLAGLRRFLVRASIGDVHLAGGMLFRVIGPRADRTSRIEFLAGAPADPLVDAARIRRLLDRAYAQFMPRMTNLIVVGGPHDRSLALDMALLGRPMERWDRFPRRGERIAVGRSDDGFWAGRSRPDSRWMLWVPTSGRGADRRSVLMERSTEDGSGAQDASLPGLVELLSLLRDELSAGPTNVRVK